VLTQRAYTRCRIGTTFRSSSLPVSADSVRPGRCVIHAQLRGEETSHPREARYGGPLSEARAICRVRSCRLLLIFHWQANVPKKKQVVPPSSRKAGSTTNHHQPFNKKLRRFIEDLRQFLEAARKDLFWVTASGVLSAIFAWQIHTAIKVVPTLLTFTRDSNRFHSETGEGDKVLLLLDTIRNVVKTLEQTARGSVGR
jgi:hypothetical protein